MDGFFISFTERVAREGEAVASSAGWSMFVT